MYETTRTSDSTKEQLICVIDDHCHVSELTFMVYAYANNYHTLIFIVLNFLE